MGYIKDIIDGKEIVNQKEIENLIKEHAQKYYDGESEISDRDFDKLVDLLRTMDPNSECLTSVGWGYDINKASGTKVNHKYQTIGSLAKYKTYDSIPMNFRGHKVVISAKLDGISAVCYFVQSKLVRAVTRGNGIVGIDITDKIQKISKSILDGNIKFTGSIRGELVISNKNWKEMLKSNPDLKSQRNYVSGIINRNDITDDLKYVSFVPYNILGDERWGSSIMDQIEVLNLLDKWYGCAVPFTYAEMRNFTNLENIYKEYAETYPVDGIVVTERFIDVSENGVVTYNQIAVKFESATEDTEVKSVQWNLTRTGKMIPVVLINPVNLDGATIGRVTGFNAKFIKDNEIDTGAIVNIMRANLVIPDIQEVVKPADKVNLPEYCPECGSRLEWNGVDLVCRNPECAGKEFSDLLHWTDVIAPVDGLGGTLKVNFYEDRNIYSIDNLYGYFKNYNGEDIGSSITDRKFSEMLRKLLIDKVDLVKVLAGMNIKRLGITSANKLASEPEIIKQIIEMKRISFDVFMKISELVGKATAGSISDESEKFVHFLLLMKDRIIFNDKKDEPVGETVNIAVTGALSMKRSEFEKIAKEHGYVLSGNLKVCKYLVTNNPDPTSSKGMAAKKYGVDIITEEEFMKIIGG